jgi:hypothetical protein
LAAGNFQEADKQFILALQIEPNNKEAWLWRGVCANPRESAICWEKSEFTRDQIVNHLAGIVNVKAILLEYSSKYHWELGISPGYESQATIYLDAVLRVQHEPLSRNDLLKACGRAADKLTSSLEIFYINSKSTLYQGSVRGCCVGLKLLLDRLGPDQSSDIIKGKISVNGLFGRESREVQEKPSYWRKYIQQLEANLPK